jgi:hypothetical protein
MGGFHLFNKHQKEVPNAAPGGSEGAGTGTGSHGVETTADVGEPAPLTGIPIGLFSGYAPPPNIAPTVPGGPSYQVDPSPVTYARYNMSRGMHDVQLRNGLQNRIGQGFIMGYQNEGYLSEVQPTWPGQQRLMGSGGSPANYTPKTYFSPQTWANAMQDAQNNSTQTAGGPGQIGGSLQNNYNQASGG